MAELALTKFLGQSKTANLLMMTPRNRCDYPQRSNSAGYVNSVAHCFRLNFHLVVSNQVSGLDERIGRQSG